MPVQPGAPSVWCGTQPGLSSRPLTLRSPGSSPLLHGGQRWPRLIASSKVCCCAPAVEKEGESETLPPRAQW